MSDKIMMLSKFSATTEHYAFQHTPAAIETGVILIKVDGFDNIDLKMSFIFIRNNGNVRIHVKHTLVHLYVS